MASTISGASDANRMVLAAKDWSSLSRRARSLTDVASPDSIISCQRKARARASANGPLSVTTELPVLGPDEVRARVRRAIDVCKGRASLVLFTANTINPDVPLANIRAMYEAVRA